MVAGVVAAGADPPRGVALLLSPAVPGEQLVGDQVARQFVTAWPGNGTYADQRRFVDQLIAAVRQGGDTETLRTRLRALAETGVQGGRIPRDVVEMLVKDLSDTDRLNAALDLRPADALSRIRTPVLALYGGKDIAVFAEQNASAARVALAGNPQAEIVVLPTLNHALQVPRSDDPEEWRLRPAMDGPEVLELVAGWVERTLKP
jgi:pimeloyl-ACP methyl ester carboxylesterase